MLIKVDEQSLVSRGWVVAVDDQTMTATYAKEISQRLTHKIILKFVRAYDCWALVDDYLTCEHYAEALNMTRTPFGWYWEMIVANAELERTGWSEAKDRLMQVKYVVDGQYTAALQLMGWPSGDSHILLVPAAERSPDAYKKHLEVFKQLNMTWSSK